MKEEFEAGDEIELKNPYRGYRYGTIIARECPYFRVEFSSGMTETFYGDEFKNRQY